MDSTDFTNGLSASPTNRTHSNLVVLDINRSQPCSGECMQSEEARTAVQ